MATVYDPDLDPMAMSDDLVGIDGPQSMPTKVTGMRARPTGIEALGVMRTSGGTIGFSAEEQRMESDLRARLNELLVLTKEGTVDAVAGLGGMLTRDSDGFEGAAPAGGMQAGEQRVRAHRQSVYGLTREPPPWSVKPGAPTTSAKISNFTSRMRGFGKGSSLTAEDVVGGRQLHSKVALITGGGSGLGYETARVLCKAGARVILGCRNIKAAEAAADKIRFELEGAAASVASKVKITHDEEWVGANYAGVGTVEVMALDLSDLNSVREFAAAFLAQECPLHYLICNAGKMAPPHRPTAQRYETQWGVNHLSHFLLANLLTEKLDETGARSSEGSRVIVLTSQSHQLGRMHWDQGFLNAQMDYDSWAAYFQSKLANVLFVREFDRLAALRSVEKHGNGAKDTAGNLKPRCTAHAINPGLAPTGITRELSTIAKTAYFGGVVGRRSVGVASATTLHCCIGKQHEAVVGGGYYEECEEVLLWDKTDDAVPEGELPEETSLEAAARLWALSEWMVQENSTWTEAHSYLFDDLTEGALEAVVEQPAEAQEEPLEKVFDYEVLAKVMAMEPEAEGEERPMDFGEAAEADGEWEEPQFDPQAAQLAAAEAAAKRAAKLGPRGGSRKGAGKSNNTGPAEDDGVEMAVLLSPAAAAVSPRTEPKRRRAPVNTPEIEVIDPLARPAGAGGGSPPPPMSTLQEDAGGAAAAVEQEKSTDGTGGAAAKPESSKKQGVGRSEGPVQRMEWGVMADDERAAAMLLGWDRDGSGWEDGSKPSWEPAVADGPTEREWRKLSGDERAGGKVLGYDHVRWDNEMAPEIVEAKAKAKKEADEAAELAMLARAAKVDAELAREERRLAAAEKERERKERKAKVAAAKAQRKAAIEAEEKEKLAADAVKKMKEEQEAEREARQKKERKKKAAKEAAEAAAAMAAAARGESGKDSPSAASSGTASQMVDVDPDEATADAARKKKTEANRKKKEKQKAKKKLEKELEASHQAKAAEAAIAEVARRSPSPVRVEEPPAVEKDDDQDEAGSDEAEDAAAAEAAEVEAALEAQAKAAFAALAAGMKEGKASPSGTPQKGFGASAAEPGTPTTPGTPGTPDEKKQAVVAAKADYFFGQAMKLHNEFANIEARSGNRKLSYFEASALADDLGLALSGPALNAALPKLDPQRTGEIRFADFEEWWKGASGPSGGQAGGGPSGGGTPGGSRDGVGGSKNSLGSAIALALAEGDFVE